MKKMVCIVCPNGCHLKIDQAGEDIQVTGNLCPRGEAFAKAEITCPMRTISSTVKTTSSEQPVVSVKVSKEIPKSKIFDVMDEIQMVVLDHELDAGQPVIQNVCDLGVDVILTTSFRNG